MWISIFMSQRQMRKTKETSIRKNSTHEIQVSKIKTKRTLDMWFNNSMFLFPVAQILQKTRTVMTESLTKDN